MNIETIRKTLQEEFKGDKIEICTNSCDLDWDGYDYIEVKIDGEPQEYRVIKEVSIERIFEEYIRDLADDCLIPDLPDNMKQYFDYDKFTSDCEMDWYGHHLNGYDWGEIYGNWIYLFRNN